MWSLWWQILKIQPDDLVDLKKAAVVKCAKQERSQLSSMTMLVRPRGKSWVATFAEGVVLVSLLALPAWCCLTDAGFANRLSHTSSPRIKTATFWDSLSRLRSDRSRNSNCVSVIVPSKKYPISQSYLSSQWLVKIAVCVDMCWHIIL